MGLSVGRSMVYLLGNWATDRRAIAVAGQLETTDLYQACLIFHCQPVAHATCDRAFFSGRLGVPFNWGP